jgi:hypothetical protein
MAENSSINNNFIAQLRDTLRAHAFRRTIAVVLVLSAAGSALWLARSSGVFASLLQELQALPQSAAWAWILVLVFVVLPVLSVLVLWKVPGWQVRPLSRLGSKERFDRENEARKTLATILAALVSLAGILVTWQYNIEL